MTTAPTKGKRRRIDPLTAYTEFQKWGTYAETGRRLQLTRERIRQLLHLGHQQGLFRFRTPHQSNQEVFPELRKLSAREIADRYPHARSVKTLSATLRMSYQTLVKHLPKPCIRTLTRYYATRYKNEIRDRIYQDYVQLEQRLGHHPSDTEIQTHKTGLSQRIRRHWKSIRCFRRYYGIRPPTSQMTLRANTARAREYQRLSDLFQQGPQAAAQFSSALSRDAILSLLREQRIYAVRTGRRVLYYPQRSLRQQLSA